MVANPEAHELIQACLNARPFAWQRFVDRFLPVVLQTVHEVDLQASRGWSEQQQEELAREFFETLRQDDYQLLRLWDQATDFETWLVIAVRRVTCTADGNQPGTS